MNDLNEQLKPSKFLPRTRVQGAVAAGLFLFLLSLGAWNLVLISSWDDDIESAIGPCLPTGRRFHGKPIIDKGGKRLLWARGEPNSPNAEWFDVTASTIDPARFQFGIGKDTIPSIDDPIFVEVDDARLSAAGIHKETMVIGFALGGEAKAYPIPILDRHELVNDRVGGKPVTVGW